MLMKRVWGHVMAGSVVLGIGSAAAFACVHDDTSVFIQNVLAPQQVTPGSGCSYGPSTTQPFIPFGVLDVALRASYDPTYLVGNQLTAEANSAQLMTETSTIRVEGATVRLTDSQGSSVGTGSFTSLTSGTIYPAVGGTPSYTPITVPSVIDSATVAAIMKSSSAQLVAGYVRVITYVRIFGHTLGGRYVESDEFEFPVDVCQACLISYSQADSNPCYKQPNCLGNPGAMATTANTAPCAGWGQDLAIDCSQCVSTNPWCSGVYVNMPKPGPEAGCVP
jgi:hypothetical protein